MFNLGSTYELCFFSILILYVCCMTLSFFGSCIMDARRRYNLARVESRRLKLETYSRQWVFSPCRIFSCAQLCLVAHSPLAPFVNGPGSSQPFSDSVREAPTAHRTSSITELI